ncbi:MAG: DUF3303 family protein [Dehalococcoidia bacterium]
MLFHVTMTHRAENCPGYDPANIDPFLSGFDKMAVTANELNVKVHSLVWAAPDHVAYALVESDSVAAIGRYVFQMPLRQEFTVTPVQHLADVVAMGRVMQAQAAN